MSIYIWILLSHKKEWNNAICSNMNGFGGHYAKENKSDRERQIPYDIAYMWNLKKWYKWTYLQNRNRPIDIEKVIYGCQRWRGGRDKLEAWD